MKSFNTVAMNIRNILWIVAEQIKKSANLFKIVLYPRSVVRELADGASRLIEQRLGSLVSGV
jgi:hypothetical protein